jgi:hypothetical protein
LNYFGFVTLADFKTDFKNLILVFSNFNLNLKLLKFNIAVIYTGYLKVEMALNIMTASIMPFSIMILYIITLSITKIVTLYDTQHNGSVVMLSVTYAESLAC